MQPFHNLASRCPRRHCSPSRTSGAWGCLLKDTMTHRLGHTPVVEAPSIESFFNLPSSQSKTRKLNPLLHSTSLGSLIIAAVLGPCVPRAPPSQPPYGLERMFYTCFLNKVVTGSLLSPEIDGTMQRHVHARHAAATCEPICYRKEIQNPPST